MMLPKKLIVRGFHCPDSVKAAGLGVYYNRKIDVDWLDKELTPESVDAWLPAEIKRHISKSKISDEEKNKLTEKTIAQATAAWQKYKIILKSGDLICSYSKAWWQLGSTNGLVILRGCTVIGEIHFPEMKK